MTGSSGDCAQPFQVMTAGEEFVTERGVVEVGPAGIAGIVDVELVRGTSLV